MNDTTPKPEAPVTSLLVRNVEATTEVTAQKIVNELNEKPAVRQIKAGFYNPEDVGIVIKQHQLVQRHFGF
jgi:hypothetical protein